MCECVCARVCVCGGWGKEVPQILANQRLLEVCKNNINNPKDDATDGTVTTVVSMRKTKRGCFFPPSFEQWSNY